jgi:AraC-like DNA-binding protein
MRYLLHDFGQFHAGHLIGPNSWPHFDLLWFHSGRATIRLGKNPPVELQGGEGVLIFPHTPFQGQALTRTAFASVQHFVIGAKASLPDPIRRWRGRENGHRIYRGPGHTAVIGDIERAISLAAEPQTPAIRKLRELNLAMILLQLDASPAAGKALSSGRDILSAWRREFRQRPLPRATVAELAARFGMSPAHLRGFLARHATTPRRFLLEIRLDHARRLLMGSPLPIKAIAAVTGYADVVAFHRAFVKYFSETPAAYRSRHRRMFTG